MFRVLIVEDDRLLCKQLKQLFQQEYRVFTAESIEETQLCIESKRLDLLILDRVLPDGDTLELLSYIRDCAPATRILMMSSKAEVSQRIKGLTGGADDYVPKPLDVQELRLRVRKLLQLERAPMDDWLQAGELRFNRITGETYAGDLLVHLRPREAQILNCLLRFKNRVVTRDTIVSHVWGATSIPTTTTLDVYLRRLRMMLGETAHCIETVRGFGYLIRDPGVAYK